MLVKEEASTYAMSIAVIAANPSSVPRGPRNRFPDAPPALSAVPRLLVEGPHTVEGGNEGSQ